MTRQLSGHALLVLLALGVGASACDTPKIERPEGSGPASGRAGSSGSGNGGGSGVSLPDAGPGAPGGGSAPGGGPNPSDKCAEQAHQAELVPLDLMLLVDTSGSMNDPAGNRSKWAMAHDALAAFVRDPGSAGLSVGLTTFPSAPPGKACNTEADCGGINAIPGLLCGSRSVCLAPGGDPAGAPACGGFPFGSTCPAGQRCVPLGRCSTSGGDCVLMGAACPGGAADTCTPGAKSCRAGGFNVGCDATVYAKPRVAFADLPAGVGALTAALDAVSPSGATPMGPAVNGVIEHLRAHLAARAGRRSVLVLATDGLPMGCTGDSIAAVATALQNARAASPAITTYVIGVFEPGAADSQASLDRLAMAGGSGRPFVLEPGQNLNTKFLEALNQIRGAALACEFQIPKPMTGVQDFGKVNVRYSAGSTAEELSFVGSADRCDPMRGGWYYDVNPQMATPSRIIVCESTCQRFKAQAGGKVEVRVGCATRID